MKTVPATEAKNRLGAILDEAQREPIVIRRQDRDIAVVLSMADYERLRAGNIRAFLDLRKEVAAQAATRGLTDKTIERARLGYFPPAPNGRWISMPAISTGLQPADDGDKQSPIPNPVP